MDGAYELMILIESVAEKLSPKVCSEVAIARGKILIETLIILWSRYPFWSKHCKRLILP